METDVNESKITVVIKKKLLSSEGKKSKLAMIFISHYVEIIKNTAVSEL